jgi:hypothetical protein
MPQACSHKYVWQKNIDTNDFIRQLYVMPVDQNCEHANEPRDNTFGIETQSEKDFW